MTLPGIAVEIALLDNETGISLTVPVLPTNGEIAFNDGDQQPLSVDIVDLGAVEIPAGVALDSIGWESFFPARYEASYCAVGADLLKAPLDYRNQFSTWKDNGTSLQIICAAAGLNKTVFVKSFAWKLKGAEGDIYYSLQLTEFKKIAPKKVTPGGEVITGLSPEDRPDQPASDAGTTYAVISGDSLSLIGKKLGIDWHRIYDNNKDVVGTNPDKLVPGQVLNV